MSSISGPTSPNYDPIYLKAVKDACEKSVQDNQAKINEAIKNAGDPDFDPTAPTQN